MSSATGIATRGPSSWSACPLPFRSRRVVEFARSQRIVSPRFRYPEHFTWGACHEGAEAVRPRCSGGADDRRALCEACKRYCRIQRHANIVPERAVRSILHAEPQPEGFAASNEARMSRLITTRLPGSWPMRLPRLGISPRGGRV